jgi:hypothetical protein
MHKKPPLPENRKTEKLPISKQADLIEPINSDLEFKDQNI